MPARRRKDTKTVATADLRRRVTATLARVPAFRRLPAAKRRRLAEAAAGIAAFTALARAVDFPDFVAGLVAGVFDAIVDGSIRQMEAYGALLASVTRSVDRFVTDDGHGSRDYLVETYPGLFEICADGSVVAAGHCPEASQGRSRRTSRGSRRRAAGKARIRRPVAGDPRAQ